jgi:hypothetical protein
LCLEDSLSLFPVGISGRSGLLNRLIGGWQWNGIVNTQTGFPFTPLIGFNNSGTGEGTQSTDIADGIRTSKVR